MAFIVVGFLGPKPKIIETQDHPTSYWAENWVPHKHEQRGEPSC